jgi:hypothetical protein
MEADDLIAYITSFQAGPVPHFFHPEITAVGPPVPVALHSMKD